MKIAKVLLDLNATALDRLFDYVIPSQLVPKVQIGARVTVPFQNRPTIAYIWEIATHSEVAALKEIIEVIDDPPLLGMLQYQLVNWLAPYYSCSRTEVLKLCLPPGTNLSRQIIYRLSEPVDQLRKELLLNFPDLPVAALVEKILKLSCKGAVHREWRNEFREYLTIFKFLLQHNFLHKETRIAPPKVKTKTRTVFFWVAAENLKETAAAQRVKQVLLTKQHGLTRAELCTAAAVSPGVLTRLQKQGKIRGTAIPMERIPCGMEQAPVSRPIVFNREQQRVLEIIKTATDQKPFLLQGITGSGKTEIYFELAAATLKQGRQVLYLVPEIALTPQTLERARARFGKAVALLHSKMSDGERFDQWQRIKSGAAPFVLGARSALFAPFDNLGLIIVDEEHETTYKQEETPRYHVRKVVEKLAEFSHAKLVFGSATPAVETYYLAESGAYHLVKLEQRYNSQPLPEVTIVDLRQELKRKNKNILSDLLYQEMQQTLDRQEQVILFLNRRGHSTFILCRDCGQSLQCPCCEVSLTYHSDENILRCHYCDYRQPVPNLCPNCQSNRIRYFGNGTQKLEAELKERFGGARIIRMDHDSTTTKGAHQQIYEELISGKVDILLGTQMIAKGLDLPKVTLVGVIAADQALNRPDFRAAERCFQLLIQVAGRAGRGTRPGRVIFQTYNPEHYAIQFAQKYDFDSFYRTEIAERRQAGYPPFSELVKFGFSGIKQTQVIAAAEAYAALIRQIQAELVRDFPRAGNELQLMGPAPAVIEKVQNLYRWQLLLKSSQPQLLERLVEESRQKFSYRKYPDVRIIRDRNPYSVL
ncbi:MAG TPA: primosomal protein N' [Bacillota bacterium]